MLLGDVMSWVSRVRWEGWVGRSGSEGRRSAGTLWARGDGRGRTYVM